MSTYGINEIEIDIYLIEEVSQVRVSPYGFLEAGSIGIAAYVI